MVKFREHPGAAVQELPLCAMTSEQVIAAAVFAEQNTTAAQAARTAILSCCASTRRNRGRRARRREMIEAGLQANAVPQNLWKYAGWAARLAAWFVPPPWNAVISAVLWVVDQLTAERNEENVRISVRDAVQLSGRTPDLEFTPTDEARYRTACRSRGDSEKEIDLLPRLMRIRYAMAAAIREGRMDPEWLS